MMHVFCNLEDLTDGHQPLCDMTFEIVDRVFDEQSYTWRLGFRADATPYKPVGFYADIPLVGWKEQIDGEGEDAFHSFWGPVMLRSRGHDSDRMLALLADFYAVTPPLEKPNDWRFKFLRPTDTLLSKGWVFPQSVSCLAVGIQSNPALIVYERVHMKLFFDEGVENGHYAEVFLDIDLPGGFCAFNEKDEEYRQELIHWLSRPGNVNANPDDGNDSLFK